MSLAEELKAKTVFELKAYAKKNNINLDGLSKKNEILEVVLNFVPKDDEVKEDKPKAAKKDKIAVYSLRNLHWQGVGVLEKGYNIITKEESEKWLKHKAVRLALPDEVAKYYGKK